MAPLLRARGSCCGACEQLAELSGRRVPRRHGRVAVFHESAAAAARGHPRFSDPVPGLSLWWTVNAS